MQLYHVQNMHYEAQCSIGLKSLLYRLEIKRFNDSCTLYPFGHTLNHYFVFADYLACSAPVSGVNPEAVGSPSLLVVSLVKALLCM